jgi:hypothetical protein
MKLPEFIIRFAVFNGKIYLKSPETTARWRDQHRIKAGVSRRNRFQKVAIKVNIKKSALFDGIKTNSLLEKV